MFNLLKPPNVFHQEIATITMRIQSIESESAQLKTIETDIVSAMANLSQRSLDDETLEVDKRSVFTSYFDPAFELILILSFRIGSYVIFKLPNQGTLTAGDSICLGTARVPG